MWKLIQMTNAQLFELVKKYGFYREETGLDYNLFKAPEIHLSQIEDDITREFWRAAREAAKAVEFQLKGE